jgi:hypothetical protein
VDANAEVDMKERFKAGDRVVFAGSLVTPYIVVIVESLVYQGQVSYVHRRPECTMPENTWNSYDEKMYMTPSEWMEARNSELLREMKKTIDTCEHLQAELERMRQGDVVARLKQEVKKLKHPVVNVDGDVVEKGSVQDDRTWLNHT